MRPTTKRPAASVAAGMDHRRPDIDRQKKLAADRATAKTGMTLSLGALVVTGMMRGRGAGKIHVAAGIALVGFSFWHHRLYQRSSGRSDC
jgi:hypothetical protein